MSSVHLTGRIDFEAAPMARQRLLAELECGDDLYIELSGVTGIDSTGLTMLFEILQVGRQIGCAVHFAGVRDDVMKMVRFANFDRVFAIRDDGARPRQIERSYQGQSRHVPHRQRTKMWFPVHAR